MQTFNEFWALVLDVWTGGVFGIDIATLLSALGIFGLFLLLRGLIARFIIATLKFKAKRTKTLLDDELLNVLEGPIRLLPVVLGAFLALDYLPLGTAHQDLADRIVKTLITIALFWAVHRAVGPLSQLLSKLDRIFTPVMLDWLVKIIKMLIAFIGIAAVLELWGIQVGPILAGLGLFGVAVALGAQDLFKNLIAGLLIIAEQRFNKGDWIRVDGVVEGTVEQIGFRSTMVRRFDKAPVFVPNAMLSDNAVTNFTAMTHRRIYWNIGVEYSTSIEQLRTIRDQIETYIFTTDDFADAKDVATFVRIDRFSDSSIDIMLYCFTNTTQWGEWLVIKEQLAYAVKDIVERAGTSFAFPSQSLYVESLPGDAPELFVPPQTKKS